MHLSCTDWPAALKVSAGIVGGNDSTRPSSCASPLPLRTALSIDAEAPATVTTTSTVCAASTEPRVTVAFAPPPVSCNVTGPAGTFASVNRPAASTTELIEAPTTLTVTPVSAAPPDADVIALDAPCTVPVIVADAPDGAPGCVPVVDGPVGDPLPPPHAPASKPPLTSVQGPCA